MDLRIEQLHRAYRSGALTPTDVVDEILQRIVTSASNNIWIARLDRAELQPYLDRLRGHSPDDLPLYGIPFAIKDNIDLIAVATTAACPTFSYVAEQSAFVVERFITAGAIPIGKTNMDQFATGLVGTRSPYGVCANAFDRRYIAGGSSAGSAVAVALGLVSFALGTDTAGSGRVPAAFNNIVGLKPSRGLLSMSGVVPACRSLDCVSIFALTTDDANTVLTQAAAYDAADDYARHNPFDNHPRHYGITQGGFRFGVPPMQQWEFFGDDSARALYASSIAQMETLGGEKIEIDFTPFMAAARLLYEGPWVAERYIATESIIKHQPDALLPVIRTIIGRGQQLSAVDAFTAQYALQHYHAQAYAEVARVDFIALPTTATIYTIEAVQADPIRLNSQLGHYTNFMNLLDCAGVAVPAGFLANGMPWGLSFVAPAFKDRMLLSFANRWQQASGVRLGTFDIAHATSSKNIVTHATQVPLVVCGAHLEGLPLHWQLRERGAVLVERTHTAPCYRMFALAGGPPHRPGLVRDVSGAAIEVEVWSVPQAEFGSFVAGIPAPLAIGKVELQDRRWLPGFVCEHYGIDGAQDITHYRGWRAYIGG